MKENISEYGGDPGSIVVCGGSAGLNDDDTVMNDDDTVVNDDMMRTV